MHNSAYPSDALIAATMDARNGKLEPSTRKGFSNSTMLLSSSYDTLQALVVARC